MAWATGPAPFLLLLFLGGLCFGLANVLFAHIWRRLIPLEQQGRFFGMQASLNQMLMPVGLAVAGLLADRLSPYAVAGGAGDAAGRLGTYRTGTAGPSVNPRSTSHRPRSTGYSERGRGLRDQPSPGSLHSSAPT